MRLKKNISVITFCLLMSFCTGLNTLSAKAIALRTIDLVSNPNEYKGKTVEIIGEKFYSYTNLPLDYEKSDNKKLFKDSKDYIGILISRPDLEEIPLVELKMSLPIKKFKKDEELQELAHGDVIKLTGKVIGTALNEPWVELSKVEIIEKNPENEEDSDA